ncbi:hypothetical protein BUALT_Bualt13G0066000 [Buddleja alternifolia]|uniref:Reverse transcriptase/retrotransposon-derived protein RNase H-like domain-containing protein n=1 Tax=Buddleja alternifolia TaxID=168488 RepID=A0AAV6WMA5_9LAMI|nr:hypothetical protein BUALT_Bualt13G0066000 [Buddleja alternifolia]
MLLFDETEDSIDPLSFSPDEIARPTETSYTLMTISHSSYTGQHEPTTLCFPAIINNHQVIDLVGSGSTNNFLHTHLMNHLGVKLHPCTPFTVTVGNGELLHYHHAAEPLNIMVQDHTFIDVFYPLPIHSSFEATPPSPHSSLIYSRKVASFGLLRPLKLLNHSKKLLSQPHLALPYFSQPFIVKIDASSKALGAVLTQSGHPIAYFSKKIMPKFYGALTYLKEMMAITSAVTDLKSLRTLNLQMVQTPEQQQWVTKLLGFNYEICYKPGPENTVAEALSRRELLQLPNFSTPHFRYLEERKKYWAENTLGRILIHQVQSKQACWTVQRRPNTLCWNESQGAAATGLLRAKIMGLMDVTQ